MECFKEKMASLTDKWEVFTEFFCGLVRNHLVLLWKTKGPFVKKMKKMMDRYTEG